jgi:hypothetical protein
MQHPIRRLKFVDNFLTMIKPSLLLLPDSDRNHELTSSRALPTAGEMKNAVHSRGSDRSVEKLSQTNRGSKQSVPRIPVFQKKIGFAEPFDSPYSILSLAPARKRTRAHMRSPEASQRMFSSQWWRSHYPRTTLQQNIHTGNFCH